MQDERDYYAILGVPANAPEAEIRRAFRTRAKELHPDSKPAGEREQAHREFNLLTEAYDTLKDAERREAYDDVLRSSRQLVRIENKGTPPGAMVMGLAFGLLLVGTAAGAVFFLDRSHRAPKSQEFSGSRGFNPSRRLRCQPYREKPGKQPRRNRPAARGQTPRLSRPIHANPKIEPR